MDERPQAQRIGIAIVAIFLWLGTFILGLNSLYALLQIFYLVYGALGGSLVQAERFAPGMVFLLGVGFLIFIIATSEYHRKRVGTPESWRLFAWTLAVEVSITILYYLL